MSKTLFNQNTFQSKNVTNSDDIQDLKVDTFKAVNLTATNITNAELQAATSGVATNAAALANKQDAFAASNRLNPNFINAEDDGDSVIITTTEFGSLTGFDNGSGTIQEQINGRASDYDVSAPLVKTTRAVPVLPENPILLSINNTSSVTEGSTDLITSGGVFTATAGQEDAFNVSAPLVKTTTSTPHVLSIDTTNTPSFGSNQLVLGGGIYQYLLDNYNAKLTNGSSLQLSIDNTGSGININDEISVVLATGASATDYGLITGKVLNDELANKQDTITNAANAGTNISIDGAGVISATGGATYTALSNGGLAVSGNEFSIDLTNTNSTFLIPQDVHIEKNGTPQLLVEPAVSNGADAEIEIRGARNASTGAYNARLTFSNYDIDLDTTLRLGDIRGKVSNADTNIGGLIISNYANGSTRTAQLTLSAAGNINIGGGEVFQDDYKLKITGNTNTGGSSYIREGLILDPFDMGVTSFTYGSDDQQSSTTSREDIYIKFAPTATVANDWAYLRNIGTSNAGRLSFDFHDDTNDVRFSIRGIHSSGQATDIITEVFDVFSSGVTAHTAIYRIPQMTFYNFNKTSMSNNAFGNGNRFTSPNSTRVTGSSFSSHSSGSITISSNGYYRIRVGANPVTDGYNDRLAFCVYLLIGSTEYFQNQNYNFHGYSYTRNSSDGAFSNINFEDYIYISSGTLIQVRTKLDVNNRNFDDQLTNSQMECFCNLQIERIAETDIS